MRFYTNGLLTLTLIFTGTVCFSQTLTPNGGIIWDVGPNDPRINVQLGSAGINIGGYEDVAPVVKNNFADTLLVKIRFDITDNCGETKTYTTKGVTLNAYGRWAPSPFFEGYSFNTTCKKLTEYGPEKNKTKTRISRIRHEVLTLRNLTQERKEAAAEKARKERELAQKRQQEEEAKRKAAEERKAEEARKLAERKKDEERKAEEAKRQSEANRAQSTAQQAGAANNGTTSTSGSTSSARTPSMQERLAQHAEQQRIAEEKRAEEQAAAEAAEIEHNRAMADKLLYDLRRQEEERRAEQQRQEALEQKRIEYIQKGRVVDAAKEEVEELQTLNLHHSNVEQMEREYAAKVSQLNTALNNLEQAKQEQWTAAVQSKDWGTDQTSQQFGEFVQTTGALANSIAENKRRREAQESLKYQRQQFLERIEQEKAQMRYDLRMEMLSNFRAWDVFTPAANEPTRMFGFYIMHNYPDLAGEQTTLTVSNVLEIGTYSDGSWPSVLFFAMVEKDLKDQYSSRRFHSNGYATRPEAERMRQALIQLFSNSGTVNETFIDANVNTPGQRTDFWESGISGK